MSQEPRGRPAPSRGLISDIASWIGGLYMSACGWKICGDWPAVPKAVIVAAPHTSNWDGIYMLAAAAYFRIKLGWMGKKSLTTGPFGGIVKWLGCVPIDRSGSNNMVSSMVKAFAERDEMLLLVPPEGTRGLVREWKSGFYHIARTAGVPMIIAILDYGTRTLRIATVFHPTGDAEADIAAIRSYYKDAVGLHRDKFAIDG
jgi:1-acyl-sn-glycerol-3-phosphate acyltransferase